MSDELPLPPVPQGDRIILVEVGDGDSYYLHSDESVQSYAREAVRAAVEKERAKWIVMDVSNVSLAHPPTQVEPVAWIHPLDMGRDCSVSAKALSDEQVPLYTMAWRGASVEYAHPPTSESTEHVAWARFVRVDDDPTRIVLCNSDDERAFKVYRSPPTSEWNDAIEAAAQAIADVATFADGDVYAKCAAVVQALKREPR